MIGKVHSTMQQHDHRSFLPALCAAVETAINEVVLRKVARSRRGKAEVQRAVELNSRRLAFGGNEVRPFQELKRFLQPRALSIVARRPDGQDLNGRPINKFGNRRDRIWSLGNFVASARKIGPLRDVSVGSCVLTNALLLRRFERKSAREIARTLGDNCRRERTRCRRVTQFL